MLLSQGIVGFAGVSRAVVANVDMIGFVCGITTSGSAVVNVTNRLMWSGIECGIGANAIGRGALNILPTAVATFIGSGSPQIIRNIEIYNYGTLIYAPLSSISVATDVLVLRKVF